MIKECWFKRWLTKLIGPEVQQPVIPPLSRAGGCRCSVKPASRGALPSRNQETLAFARDPWLNTQLGVGKPARCNHQAS
ncbi:hypothetical protein DEO72_LG3g2853 [Vigna unguiculata]|uniref:Uncharacterized protein n=1 Tax=Vigna unguiculata TaxID=3917 RepID=A0A4D6LI22_VIGUN|nr:hypothetical protein DEO72_LG3g2853 [Vigna unguiculata]